jgi:hypothetical protein
MMAGSNQGEQRVTTGNPEEIKAQANEKDVPYQSLMKVYLAERLALERGRKVPA